MTEPQRTAPQLIEDIKALIIEIQQLYCHDEIPWIIGYSGGKDSTATLQLVWQAIQQLPSDRRTKQIHVITTDTRVENPIVAAWVKRDQLPICKPPPMSKAYQFLQHYYFPMSKTPSGWTSSVKAIPHPAMALDGVPNASKLNHLTNLSKTLSAPKAKLSSSLAHAKLKALCDRDLWMIALRLKWRSALQGKIYGDSGIDW